MSRWIPLLLGAILAGAPVAAAESWLDGIGERLTWSSSSGEVRAKLGGLLDLEGYALPQPLPGVIDAKGDTLFSPRLTLYLDAQLGPRVYAFAQARADRGFDPGERPLRGRLDEYALRFALGAERTAHLQVGQFATVVGSWAVRHDAWTNPFITAPMPYDNLTGVWDNEPPRSTHQLLLWSHMRSGMQPAVQAIEKSLRVPVIWGPSYATGVAVAGEQGNVRYALEMKNASLSSRPEAWPYRAQQFEHPTFSGRLRYSADPRWEYGLSASSGSFLRPVAEPFLAPGIGRGRFRQTLFGADVSYAWKHLQVWAEAFVSRFQVPPAGGNADTGTYYVEARYKMTPRFSAAVRWNQQFFGRVWEGPKRVRWGRDAWRFDVAPTYRFSPHTQLKVQYSVQSGEIDPDRFAHLGAVQLTVKF